MQRLVLGIAIFTTACGTDEPTPSFRYTGTMHVTESEFATSVFGKITIPEELVPTASTPDCDYFGTRLRAGVTLGDLTLSGFGNPVVIEPSGFIDGTLYLGSLGPNALPDGAVITAVIADARDPLTIEAPAPATLTGVVLPASVSLTTGASITWQPGDGDEVEVALEITGLGTEQTLRCRTADTGSFAFPADALALVATGETDALVSVTRRNLGQTSSELADAEISLALESQAFATVALTP